MIRLASLKALVLSSILVIGVAASAWAQNQQSAAGAVTAPRAAVPSGEYLLGPGDSVRITVFQNPDLSLEARLSEAGVISFPLIGTISLVGLTTSLAEKRIADGLREGNFVKQPQVSVLVSQVRGNQVSVLGQVGRPGRYPIETAELRLTDLLATAGGIAPGGADVVTVVGTRKGQAYRVQVDLPSVFASDRRIEDVLLQNGDVVWVDRSPTIYVYGEVQRPGPLRLERNMSVMQALASAGGITQRGTERGLRVNRRDADGKMRTLEPQMTDILRPDDVVFIRESIF